MLERGSKIFSCFLDVQKGFDTVWIDGLMYKLFSDLGVNGDDGDDTDEELYKYKNLGVLKNYCGSVVSNISDNIDKMREKASNVDCCKTNPSIYVKLWRQACLPSLFFGADLFMVTPSLLLELEYCLVLVS